MLIKIVILLFSLFALSKAFFRYKKHEISSKELILWAIFWAMVVTATLWHRTTDIIAEIFGVERGADFLVYLSVIVLFFLIFKVLVKIEKIERDITKIVREVAVKDVKK